MDTISEQDPAENFAGGSAPVEPIYEFDASSGRFSFALNDLSRAVSRPKLAWAMIKNGFLSRYQGTALGGLWVTLTTAMTVCGLGLLYGRLFGAELSIYFPYVAVGIVVWGLISSIINEGASVFLAASGYFNETAIAKSLFPLRIVGIAAIGFRRRCNVGSAAHGRLVIPAHAAEPPLENPLARWQKGAWS